MKTLNIGQCVKAKWSIRAVTEQGEWHVVPVNTTGAIAGMQLPHADDPVTKVIYKVEFSDVTLLIKDRYLEAV